MYDKANLDMAWAVHVDAKNPRPNIETAVADGHRTAATDGHMCIEAPAAEPGLDVPALRVPTALLKAGRAVKTPMALVGTNGGCRLSTVGGNLEAPLSPGQDIPFPSLDAVRPKGPPTATICLDPKLLQAVAAYAKRHSDTGDGSQAIVLDIQGPKDPVEFRIPIGPGRVAWGVIMPRNPPEGV